MFSEKIKKIINIIWDIKNDNTIPLISDFLDWFYDLFVINFKKNTPNSKLNKWEIYFINLWKNIWTELNKNRPCIIYSSYFFNNWGDVVIVPLKSYKWRINKNINVFITKTQLNWLKKDSIIDIPWIRQVSKKRIWKYIWKTSLENLYKIDNKMLKFLEIKKKK